MISSNPWTHPKGWDFKDPSNLFSQFPVCADFPFKNFIHAYVELDVHHLLGFCFNSKIHTVSYWLLRLPLELNTALWVCETPSTPHSPLCNLQSKCCLFLATAEHPAF